MSDSTTTSTFIPVADHPRLSVLQRHTALSVLGGRPGHERKTLRVRVFPYRGLIGKLTVDRSSIRLCLHPAVLDAPRDVFSALVHVLAARLGRHAPHPRELGLVQAFAHGLSGLPLPRSRPVGGRPPRGEHHDLTEIFDAVNTAWFDGQVEVELEWMARRAFRKLAEYRADHRLIRVSPLLDHPDVPRRYLEFLLYHEMLHAFLGHRDLRSGRRVHHHRHFRNLERAHPAFADSVRFERTVLPRLRRKRRSPP